MADQRLYPTLQYEDARAAIDWLCEAFGFEEVAAHDDGAGNIVHAELAYDGGVLMLGTKGAGTEEWSPGRGGIYVAVDDPDAHHDRAKAAGAEIVRGLIDQDYGSREYVARDPEGNLWSFGTYRPTV